MLGNWKTVEHESDGDITCNWFSWYSHQNIGTRTGRLGNKRTNGHHPNCSNIKIGSNTEKNLEDLRRLEKTCCHTNFSEKLSANAGGENFQNDSRKRTCYRVDFFVPENHKVKINENENTDKYLDPVKELKKLCNMKVAVIPIVVIALGMVS